MKAASYVTKEGNWEINEWERWKWYVRWTTSTNKGSWNIELHGRNRYRIKVATRGGSWQDVYA